MVLYILNDYRMFAIKLLFISLVTYIFQSVVMHQKFPPNYIKSPDFLEKVIFRHAIIIHNTFQYVFFNSFSI